MQLAAPTPIVVTGASGFVGRALVRALVRRRACVTAVSRRSLNEAGAACVEVTSYHDTPRDPDAVLVHLAEESNIATANRTGMAHVDAVRACATALVAKAFRHVVYASSGQVYRAGSGADPYVIGKLAVEAIVLAAGGAVIRLANLYGPQMSSQTLIGDILRQIPGTGPLRLRNAAPRRDFLWIDDAVTGIAAVAYGAGRGIYDLGSGASVSAGELARLALAAAGESERPVEADVDTASEDDSLMFDIAPIRNQYGWHPTIGLGEGLARLMTIAA
jgi:nucleoside-diphosphate-sugar epimerase